MNNIKNFENFSMRRDNCDRCGQPTNNLTMMSIFNQDVICMYCKEKEKKDPDYELAKQAEEEAVRRGDTNYPGLIPNYKPLD
jgi:hypothetical protein